MPVRLHEIKEEQCLCGDTAEVRILLGTLGQTMTITRCSNPQCEIGAKTKTLLPHIQET